MQQQRDRNYYLSLRQRFTPETCRLVIIAESPPANGKYFYDTTGRKSEPLFSALVSALNRRAGILVDSKEHGLRAFQSAGWMLIDATYKQVDDGRPQAARKQAIVEDFPSLLKDLEGVANDNTPIVLIKSNVCSLLEPRLLALGRYNVINRGVRIPFPAYGHAKEFAKLFESVLKAAGI